MAERAPLEQDSEVVDGIVVAAARPLPERRVTGRLVRTQAAVVAGSFAIGAATAVVVAQRRARALPAGRKRRGKASAQRVAASRSFLVDVHLLDRGR
ncbi:unannotated protein [freshwater metagenome]|uniref:Unannotated protein n=1 Tax=freshwater metagenome TaxID=449393 RepID=A0A6J7IZM8_9ZZZZ|nr:hypothetical protein [Actinomycetota bacterium]